MIKKTNDQFAWRLPFYGGLAAVTAFLPLVLLSADAVILYVLFTLSVVLALLLLAILGKGRSRLSILSMLVVYSVASWPLIENFGAIRPALRWFLWSKQFKAAALAEPDPLYGGLKHMEWDGWGFAGAGDTYVYLVYAPGNFVDPPGDEFAAADTSHFSRDLADLPEGVHHVQRLEPSWYSVVFYTDTRWTDHIPSGNIFPPLTGLCPATFHLHADGDCIQPPCMASPTRRILVADDQAAVRDALRLLLKGEGFQAVPVTSPAETVAAVQKEDFDLALIDLNYTRDTTSGQEGLDLLGRLLATEGAPPVVVMTAWATVDLAVEAMRRGARDFIQKPWENARVLATVRTQIELAGIRRRNARLESENGFLRSDCEETVGRAKGADKGEAYVAGSAAMRPVLDTIASVGPADAPVLITGENGTGKGLAARLLHAASARADKGLVSVNMGGLSENIFESELFGHVKGAFTDAKTDRVGRFELADGGTLFLDEIANVPLAQQAKLLRLLETGEFERVGSSRTRKADVRLLSATNADLPAEVAAGRFRRDLLYRLNTVEIHLPPLRDRPEDIPALAGHFLDRHVARYRKRVTGLDDAATGALLAHSWPGNVRELDHAMERGVLMTTGERVRAADLGLWAGGAARPGGGSAAPALEDMSLEEVEKFLIQKALARHGGRANAAAEALGLSRSAFYRRLQQYGL